MNLNEIYNVEDFESKFEKFVEKNEFGTSVYMLVYKKGLITSDLKEYILKLKYKHESFESVMLETIPPFYMKELKNIVEQYYKLNEKLMNV
ncbi:MAG: hypothetical protein KAI79_13650 [Bacteroidales bacterium]|nr:hypothetical protein [Bacteroidales bacterium]